MFICFSKVKKQRECDKVGIFKKNKHINKNQISQYVDEMLKDMFTDVMQEALKAELAIDIRYPKAVLLKQSILNSNKLSELSDDNDVSNENCEYYL